MIINRLPSGDFILLGHANPPTVTVSGNYNFFITRLATDGALETYDAATSSWRTANLTFNGAAPAYGVPAVHRKENVGTPPGVATGLWTAVVPGGQFADAVTYTVRLAAGPSNAFLQVFQFELTT